jgi:hypothetical protein
MMRLAHFSSADPLRPWSSAGFCSQAVEHATLGDGRGARMLTRIGRVVLLSILCPLSFATCASAECAWVLWVEAPAGSDQWSVASVPESRFARREDCQRRADDLNTFELTVAKMQGASGNATDAFSCLPCTVDPRPEGALAPDTGSTTGEVVSAGCLVDYRP